MHKKAITAGIIAVALMVYCCCAPQAMGKRPEQGKAAAVSRLTPEQELRAKAEFDSLMAIYDPWEALKDGERERNKLEYSGKSKGEVYLSLKDMVEKYRGSALGDQILIRLITIITNMPYSGDSYKDALQYAIRLSEEYPISLYADKGLFYVGAKYAGGVDESNGKRVAPYIELVKRHPNSRFVPFSLFVVSESAEYDTSSEFAPDFDTRMWAYTLLRKKYDNQVFYFNIYDDPKMEAIYNDKNNRQKMIDEIIKEKQEVGKKILGAGKFASPIFNALENYRNIYDQYITYSTNNSKDLYNKLLPYCQDDNVFKKYNPFEKYKDVHLNYFKSEKNKIDFELQLFDIKNRHSKDMTITR